MKQDFGFLKALSKGEVEGPDAELNGDLLVIDCRGCDVTPVPGSKECIGCMVSTMCRTGGADRVVMRTGRDIEISGKAGRVLKDAASLRRWSLPPDAPKGRCRTCPISRQTIVSMAWDRFPNNMTGGLASEVMSQIPEREGCAECAATTVKALEQIESGMSDIRNRMSDQIRKVMG